LARYSEKLGFPYFEVLIRLMHTLALCSYKQVSPSLYLVPDYLEEFQRTIFWNSLNIFYLVLVFL